MTERPADDPGADADLLPEQTADDTDLGWGEPPPEDDESDDERLIREKPPHW